MRHVMIALLATFVAVEVGACSCAPAGSVDAAFQNADTVFAGVVVSVEDPRGDRIRALPERERAAADRSPGPEWGRKVTFRVMQWWKTDTLTGSVELWTGY